MAFGRLLEQAHGDSHYRLGWVKLDFYIGLGEIGRGLSGRFRPFTGVHRKSRRFVLIRLIIRL